MLYFVKLFCIIGKHWLSLVPQIIILNIHYNKSPLVHLTHISPLLDHHFKKMSHDPDNEHIDNRSEQNANNCIPLPRLHYHN